MMFGSTSRARRRSSIPSSARHPQVGDEDVGRLLLDSRYGFVAVLREPTRRILHRAVALRARFGRSLRLGHEHRGPRLRLLRIFGHIVPRPHNLRACAEAAQPSASRAGWA